MGQLSELPIDPATSGGYTPEPYSLTESVLALSSVPRFTSSQCTEDLFDSNLRDEYLVGLISGSIFILCLYLIWTLVLLVLKCLGPKRAGCASGTPVEPSKPVNARNATGSRLRRFNPYEEGADEEFLAEVAEERKGVAAVASKDEGGGSGNIGEYGGIGDDGDGIYEAAHRARYGPSGGTYTTADFGGMGAAGDASLFHFTDTATSELAFGEEAQPGKGTVAPFVDEADADVEEFDDEHDCKEALVEWEKKKKRYGRRMTVTRVLFLFSGCAVITASSLFYAKGILGLTNTIGSVQKGLTYTHDLLMQAHDLTADFIQAQSAVLKRRAEFDTAQNSCPSLFDEQPIIALPPGVDGNGTIPPSDNVTAIVDEAADAVRGAIQNASLRLESVGDQLVGTAVDLQNGFKDAALEVNQIQEQLENLKPYIWASLSFAIMMDLIILVFMCCVLAAWCDCKCNASCFMRFIQNGLCMPLLLIFVFLSWILASVFLVVAVGAADFCVAPDVHVTDVLEKMRADILAPGSEANFVITIVYDLILYYVRQCRVDYYPESVNDDVQDFAALVGEAANSFDVFLDSVSSGDNLDEICGDYGALVISNVANLLHTQLHVVWDVLLGILDLLGCHNFNPIYNSISHDAICVNGQGALAWIFATSMCIAIFSMSMVSLRAAWYSQSVEKAEEHVIKSVEAEKERIRRERREQCCGNVLWALLVALMVSALISSIYFSLNGFHGVNNIEQCPAEQRQFEPVNSRLYADQGEDTITPPIKSTSRPTIAPTIPPTTVTRAFSEQPTGEQTFTPSLSTQPSSTDTSIPTPSPTNDFLDTSAPTEGVSPQCTGRRNVLHKIIFDDSEMQGGSLGMTDEVKFAIKTKGAGGIVEEATVYNADFDSANANEHVVCLLRQVCYDVVINERFAALVQDGLTWEIQQIDPGDVDVDIQSPIVVASGGLPGAITESCSFTVPLINSSRQPTCKTTCSARKEQDIPTCKSSSTLHELAFLTNADDKSFPEEMTDAEIKISARLPSGTSRIIRTVTGADLNSQKHYFCLREDRCYSVTVEFPTESFIKNENTVEWQMRKVLTGQRAGEIETPIASGVIAPPALQGPGDAPIRQCTFSLSTGSNGVDGSVSNCPSTCASDNIFDEGSQKSSIQDMCKGWKEVLHEVVLAATAGNSRMNSAILTIKQGAANAAGGKVVYSLPFGSVDKTKYVCLKRQQCFSAFLDGVSVGDEIGGSWRIQEAKTSHEEPPIIIASGDTAAKECKFTVVLKNQENEPACPTTCASEGTPWHEAQPHLTGRNTFDVQQQHDKGLAPTGADNLGHSTRQRNWAPH
uniref:Uncharacterized protein n=1 Tax=Odontella aurita TaxID=265563 RepID=A0A7S4J3H6_9STRA|mmetsp:Transcript_37352/g.111903  ORF Transcript_37352/g.111903 Transcript_37352/m.111903 type:complete len:1324 (+) Transcript_37352:240-4211(+)|eukprot:CAMPEP_0113566044 /NCGR_PEP_ID=MMETSP0015_2-20120614/22508_1 /TAXON_ID=2838 /ORGANISM="Odontella" /LENGTH=1323 /DNA_ID=CAMNT_0000468297 /DNA_START=119 /DNA_END=4090 /DNA_ORIENTATION=+ /assembly_acc=CAM_ASM_000160